MTMGTNGTSEALAAVHEYDTEISRVDVKAVALLNRSEVDAQLDAAHRYPRSVGKFMKEALTLATLSREVAESCIYALPRGGKIISGPSVRLAEICASAYGNLHIAARVVDAEDKEVIAQGVAWDLEKNLRVTIEARRRITNKSGRRYDDDMITVTGAAAGSIALRNAIFRVVPRAYVDTIYQQIRKVAVGDATTLAARRAEVVLRLQKMGVPVERIFVRVEKERIEDVGLDELEVLIGLGTAIKNKEASIDDAFPPVDSTPAKSRDLEAALGAESAAKPVKPTKADRAAAKAAGADPATGEQPHTPEPERDPVTGEIVPPEAK